VIAPCGGGGPMTRGTVIGERVATSRGQIYEWTGEAWLWIAPIA
jgi:hypothetical protein